MRNSLILILTSLFIFRSCVASADSTAGSENEFGKDFKQSFSSQALKDDFLSPLKTNAKFALIIGSSATAAVLIFRRELDEKPNDYFEKNRPLGTSNFGANVGQLVPNLVYYFGQTASYFWSRDRKYSKRANLMLRSTLHSSVVSTALKFSVREGRPYDHEEKTSFPSGHTTTTFAFASVVAMEHEWYWGLGAYALASYVGLSRVNDHQHYLHDVLAGATIGISYGMGVYYDMTNASSDQGSSNLAPRFLTTLLPSDDLTGAMLCLSGTF